MSQNPFWFEDPTILVDKNKALELWPASDMCFEAKMNAVSRLVILLSILGYVVTKNPRILFIGVATLLVLVGLYRMRKQKNVKSVLQLTESFTNNNKKSSLSGSALDSKTTIINPQTLEHYLKSEFKLGTDKNPFSNVLLTQIHDEPKRKAAPPSFNVDVDEDIVEKTKAYVQNMNPGIKNTNKQLFSSLTDNFQLDQSMRVFHSMPNTRVASDQGAFAQWLYGDMPSSHDSNAAGANQRVADAYRYTLY